MAQTAINGGSPSEIRVGISVRASVASACEFTTGAGPGGSRFLGDITQPFSTDFPFSIHCNTPARVAVVSENGGLLTADGPTGAGYSRSANYEVLLRLFGDSSASNSGTCMAADLKATAGSACQFRGPATATTGLLLPGPSTNAPGSSLTVRSTAATRQNLLAASTNYQDRLTVTLSPAQ
jgi:hypothetical protein